LDKSEAATVVKIDTNDIQKLRKLTAFGIMPGSRVSIIQKYPAIVIQVGYTQLAMDNDIAKEILVEK
jgi:Fe2+ transport system protein FeoA